jgi:hypothetical protein
MRFVMYGFATPPWENLLRKLRVNRMLCASRRPLMKNFLQWTFAEDGIFDPYNEKANTTVPRGTHLFDWLEAEHQIDTAFVFASSLMIDKETRRSNDPLDLLNALADQGHEFGKWTAACLRRHHESETLPVLMFSAPADAVLVRMYYGEDADL